MQKTRSSKTHRSIPSSSGLPGYGPPSILRAASFNIVEDFGKTRVITVIELNTGTFWSLDLAFFDLVHNIINFMVSKICIYW